MGKKTKKFEHKFTNERLLVCTAWCKLYLLCTFATSQMQNPQPLHYQKLSPIKFRICIAREDKMQNYPPPLFFLQW